MKIKRQTNQSFKRALLLFSLSRLCKWNSSRTVACCLWFNDVILHRVNIVRVHTFRQTSGHCTMCQCLKMNDKKTIKRTATRQRVKNNRTSFCRLRNRCSPSLIHFVVVVSMLPWVLRLCLCVRIFTVFSFATNVTFSGPYKGKRSKRNKDDSALTIVSLSRRRKTSPSVIIIGLPFLHISLSSLCRNEMKSTTIITTNVEWNKMKRRKWNLKNGHDTDDQNWIKRSTQTHQRGKQFILFFPNILRKSNDRKNVC